jgi:hypothetical protein
MSEKSLFTAGLLIGAAAAACLFALGCLFAQAMLRAECRR